MILYSWIFLGEDKKENDGWCWSDYVVFIVVGMVVVVVVFFVLLVFGFGVVGIMVGFVVVSV